MGLPKSASEKPTARSIARFGERCTPSVIVLLRRSSMESLPRRPARPRQYSRWTLAQEALEEDQGLPFLGAQRAIGRGRAPHGLQEYLPVLERDRLGVHLVRRGRDLEPSLDLVLLRGGQLKLAHHPVDEGPLVGAHLEIGPHEGADEAKELEAGLVTESLHR